MISIDELSSPQLKQLLISYNRYIQEANDADRYQEGWYPVCIEEFLNSEEYSDASLSLDQSQPRVKVVVTLDHAGFAVDATTCDVRVITIDSRGKHKQLKSKDIYANDATDQTLIEVIHDELANEIQSREVRVEEILHCINKTYG